MSGQPVTDVEGNARFDDPGTPNTGAGPRTFDDRGAYELRPAGDSPPSAVLSVNSAFGPRWQFPTGSTGSEPLLWGRMFQFGGTFTF